MSVLGHAKNALNRLAQLCNAKVISLTEEKAESARLARLAREGHFDSPAFPLLPQFLRCNPTQVLSQIEKLRPRLARFAVKGGVKDYCYANEYFGSPDAEVLYSMVFTYQPRLIVEVGSGNSTLLFRHAIEDAGLRTRLVSIDPKARVDIAGIADEWICAAIEETAARQLFPQLQAGDILFIDSSHLIKAANDVLYLYLDVLPSLAQGVLVHIHDVFLPYEYPREWLVDFRWSYSEQYLIQALLSGSDLYEVLWPGYYFQKSVPNFAGHFNPTHYSRAQSLWIQKRGGAI